MIKKAGYAIAFFTVAIIINALEIINIPYAWEMKDFQINLFTICSVLAGFSFTVMGLLTTILSDELIRKLKNTSVVTSKSELILKSIIWFGVPAVLSVLFFTGIIDKFCSLIKLSFIEGLLFVSQIECLLIGFWFFFQATKGVYKLIQKIYGYNQKEMENKKTEFDNEMEQAKKRRDELKD
ncbi:MAG: hypothetical protein SOR93_06510 [Clostridiales Family XIII bacterium]|nr:hypothetical protein [Clostridia bacterium]MDY3010906.1 hypothetical protein [Clostridiales Family XIII bacterium]